MHHTACMRMNLNAAEQFAIYDLAESESCAAVRIPLTRSFYHP